MRGRRRTDGWLGARGCPTRIPYGAAPDFRCGVHRPGDESAHRPGRVVSVEKRICHRLAEGVEGILPDLPVPKTFQGRLAQANIERHREQAPKSFPGAVEPLPTVVQEAEVCRTRTRSLGSIPGSLRLARSAQRSSAGEATRPVSRGLGQGPPAISRPRSSTGLAIWRCARRGCRGVDHDRVNAPRSPPPVSPAPRRSPPSLRPHHPCPAEGSGPPRGLRRRPVAGG
jgi:hypothetical protein